MKLRTRTRTVWGRSQKNLPMFVPNGTGTPGVFTADVPAEPLSLNAVMQDYDKHPETVFADCYQRKTRLIVGGQLSWHHDDIVDHYIHATESDVTSANYPIGDVYGIPLMSVAQLAMDSFPTFRRIDTPVRAIKQAIGYDSFASGPMKKPRVSLNKGFSVANFLAEYKETGIMIGSWLSKKNLIKRYHAIAGYNQTLKGRAKALASERLAHVYGTKLFLQDAETLFRRIVDWKSRADKFLSEAGTVKHVHKEPIITVFTPESQVLDLPMFGITNSKVTYSQNIEVECHATLAYTYTCPKLKAWISRLAQLSDTFGVRPDAGVVWDAIPFTFVVDWFVNVSEWLHANVARDWFKVDVVMLDYCHSAKITHTKDLSWLRWAPFSGPSPILKSDSLLTSITTFYARRSDKIPDFDKVELKLLNKEWKIDRIINATCLVAQRLLRDKAQTKKVFDFRNISSLIRRARRIAETRQHLAH